MVVQKYITKALQVDEKVIFYTNSIVGNSCINFDIEVEEVIDDYFKKKGSILSIYDYLSVLYQTLEKLNLKMEIV